MPSAQRPVLVAPDAFAGALRASAVAAAIARGLERAGLAPPDCCPVADGGPGSIDVLLPALGGETIPATVRDARGLPSPAQLALLENGGTALVEAAGVADPATTRPVGELIAAAARTGAAVVLVAAGGVRAADDGADAVAAIEAAGGLGGARLVVLAPRAAGGLAGALGAMRGAVREPAVPWVLDALGFDERMRAAHAVVTGERRLDARTLAGRAVAEICVRARQAGVPAHAIVGADAMDPFDKRILDLQWVGEAADVPALEAAGEALGAALRAGAA